VQQRAFSDAEVDAAVAALSDPGRLRDAQDVLARAAPQLQRILAEALGEGGWFGPAHEDALGQAASAEDFDDRVAALRTLIAEETRMGMLVGAALGYQLAHELDRAAGAERPAS
jgi:hypothetical protein